MRCSLPDGSFPTNMNTIDRGRVPQRRGTVGVMKAAGRAGPHQLMLGVIVVAMVGCSSWSGVIQPKVPDNIPSVYVMSGGDEPSGPAVTTLEAPEPDPEDLIEAGDVLEIVVRRGAGEEKYQAAVRANGIVTVSFQEINVKGLTEFQAEERINQELSKVIRNPSSQVRVAQKTAGRAKNYYAIGEVKSPGKIPIARRMTLLQAVAVAGGYTDIALTEKVVVISKQSGRKPLIRIVNMKVALISGDQAPDIPINDNDIIFVPRSTAGDFLNYYNKVALPIIGSVTNVLNGVFIGKALDASFRTPTDQPVTPAIPVCWVAGVLYGDHAWQTNVLRWYITGPLSEHRVGRWFADLYRRHGQQVAHVLERHPSLQMFVKPLFDRLLAQAIKTIETRTHRESPVVAAAGLP
ncbi:MAG: polysaccharide export protein [Nitrospirae bacterium]|nr:MAG: polysaccharide export protein [Nitrospirota bacterium]